MSIQGSTYVALLGNVGVSRENRRGKGVVLQPVPSSLPLNVCAMHRVQSWYTGYSMKVMGVGGHGRDEMTRKLHGNWTR